MKAILQQFARLTVAHPAQVAAIKRRAGLDQDPTETAKALLMILPVPPADAVRRIRARLAVGSHAERRRSLAWAAVAALSLIAAGGAGAAWLTREVPLNTSLVASTSATLSPTPEVALRYTGDGRVTGTAAAPRIEWAYGSLTVEVQPNRGVQLSVRTAEAEVRVVGTRFIVERSALGTDVSVSHGKVAVVCDSGVDAVLSAGETLVCLPTTSGGLLGRAQALNAAGAPDEEVLLAAESGIAAEPHGVIADELRLMQMQALAALSRHEEAYRAATDALAGSVGPRREDFEHVAAREAMRAQGCAAALPRLQVLHNEARATAPELVLLADCASAHDAGLARAALLAALRLGVPPDQEDAVVQRLVDLGGTRP